MTPSDAVLEDALRAAGYTHVTVWHVRALEAWAAQVEAVGLPRGSTRVMRAGWVEMRLKADLYAGSIDVLHGEAQWLDARQTARKSAERAALRMVKEMKP